MMIQEGGADSGLSDTPEVRCMELSLESQVCQGRSALSRISRDRPGLLRAHAFSRYKSTEVRA